jgi:hypothetical protein
MLRFGRARGVPLVVLLAAALGALAAPVRAQEGNRIGNGRFDDADEIDGWTAPFPEGDLAWAEFDDDDFCLNSGAAEATSTTEGASQTVFFYTCVSPVTGSAQYRLSASFWFKEGVFDGNAQTNPLFFDEPGCAGGGLASPGFFAGTAVTEASNWQRFSVVGTAPAAAESAQIRFQLVKEVGSDPQLQVLVDELYFGPPGYIFADDFEVGAGCRWTTSPDDPD